MGRNRPPDWLHGRPLAGCSFGNTVTKCAARPCTDPASDESGSTAHYGDCCSQYGITPKPLWVVLVQAIGIALIFFVPGYLSTGCSNETFPIHPVSVSVMILQSLVSFISTMAIMINYDFAKSEDWDYAKSEDWPSGKTHELTPSLPGVPPPAADSITECPRQDDAQHNLYYSGIKPVCYCESGKFWDTVRMACSLCPENTYSSDTETFRTALGKDFDPVYKGYRLECTKCKTLTVSASSPLRVVFHRVEQACMRVSHSHSSHANTPCPRLLHALSHTHAHSAALCVCPHACPLCSIPCRPPAQTARTTASRPTMKRKKTTPSAPSLPAGCR